MKPRELQRFYQIIDHVKIIRARSKSLTGTDDNHWQVARQRGQQRNPVQTGKLQIKKGRIQPPARQQLQRRHAVTRL